MSNSSVEEDDGHGSMTVDQVLAARSGMDSVECGSSRRSSENLAGLLAAHETSERDNPYGSRRERLSSDNLSALSGLFAGQQSPESGGSRKRASAENLRGLGGMASPKVPQSRRSSASNLEVVPEEPLALALAHAHANDGKPDASGANS
jgi:hypothetical protein